MWRRQWTIALALLVLVPTLVGFKLLDDRRTSDLRRAQIADEIADAWERYDNAIGSCDRGNVLRRAANDQATAVRAISIVLSAFFDSSVVLRRDAGRPGYAEEAASARDAVARIAKRVQPIQLVDCGTVIATPTAPRPSP